LVQYYLVKTENVDSIRISFSVYWSFFVYFKAPQFSFKVR